MYLKDPTFLQKSGVFCLTNEIRYDIICEKYGEVLKWGRLRALPAADTASNKEWPRSKFLSDSDLKFWAPQQDEEVSPAPKFLPCIFLNNSIFLWRSTQVAEEA